MKIFFKRYWTKVSSVISNKLRYPVLVGKLNIEHKTSNLKLGHIILYHP